MNNQKLKVDHILTECVRQTQYNAVQLLHKHRHRYEI